MDNKPTQQPEEQLDALLTQFLEEENTDNLQNTDSIEDLNEKLEALLGESTPEEQLEPKESAEKNEAPQEVVLEAPISQDAPVAEIQAVDKTGLIRLEDMQKEPPPPQAEAEPQAQEALPPEEDENPEPVLPLRQEDPAVLKKKPRNEKNYGLFGLSHIAATVIWLALIAAIGAAIGNAIWLAASDVLAFGREDMQVTITITENDDMDSITAKLQQMGLIKYPTLFKLYVQVTEDIPAPGTYELNTLYDYHALVKKMRPVAGARVTVDVMIPEGYTCQQIFQLLQDKGVCSIADLETAAMTAELGNHWFLDGLERADKYCLEGYLFPDTYEFYVDDDADRVLRKFLNNFDRRFTETMSDKLTVLNIMLSEKMKENGLSQDYIDKHQLTIREIVIIASLIERESSKQTEIYKISSVIYNRLTDPENYPTLDIDATLIYLTGRNEITEADKLIDSPYNSYIQKGLIPGAICNPGRTSINAALDPEDTDYHFYALDPATGDHHFSVTYKEHQAFLDSIKNKEED